MSGETVEILVRVGETVIEQILSAESDTAVDYDQDHDEWVVVLAGAAEIEVKGERVSLGPGEWILLPGRTPHRLVRTEHGTSWLAVHIGPD